MKLLCYCREFLARPHPQVGRPGPTCPFIPKALKESTLYLSVVRTGRHTNAAVIRSIVVQCIERFLTLSPAEAPGKFYKAVVLIFADVKVSHATELIDGVQAGKFTQAVCCITADWVYL